ncbi:MAG TPA: zf-HC2 domain-containing protein [Blastocatellia bacterium]|jgi:hypothetical protein|nr:zf-HC2 domain-containing protein [Blastocatellia bacterium]
MICNQCQELVSDYIDGVLELGEQLQVERHLADCEGCRAVRDDLLQIVHFSRQLPLQTPSGAVWARISSEVATQQPPSIWSRLGQRLSAIKSAQLNLSFPQLAASMAILVLAASVGIALLRNSRPMDNLTPGEFSIASQDRSPLSHQDMAQMEERIKELTLTVEERKQNWDPDLRAAFQRNMIYIEQCLAECRHELAGNPGDGLSQELMLGAYREKVRVLEGFANF